MDIIISERDGIVTERLRAGEEYCLKFTFPIRDIQCYWHPALRTPSQKLHWRISFQSSAVCHFPFLSFFNTEGINRLAVMFRSVEDECDFFFHMNQGAGVYEAEIRITPVSDTLFSADTREKDWQEILEDYRATLELPPVRKVKGAWDPVYCTWYAFHTGVSEEILEKNCAIASDLGFRTLLVDDGWSFDTVKRHSPELIPTWYSEIGEWQVSQAKFPDFTEHVRKIHALGMKYMLWTAPQIIGIGSPLLKQLQACDLDEKPEAGARWLLPVREEVQQQIIEKFLHLVREYGIDGLKIDYLDYFQPDPQAPKGRMIRDFARRISEALRADNPEILIEYRQNYTVPGMLPFATQYRALDVPYDWLDNFLRLCQMRTMLGDGLPLHADPAFWRPDEPLHNIGRHMIAALAGVPMISMELTTLPELHLAVIRQYLDLYRNYPEFLQSGKWRVGYELGNVVSLTAEYGEKSLQFINSRYVPVSADAELVFNLSSADLPGEGLRCFDAAGHTVANRIPTGGFGVSSQ